MALRQLIKTGQFANVEDPRKVRQYFDERLKGVQDFVSNRCIRGSTFRENSTTLYNAYCEYCQSNGRTRLADSTFGAYLKDLGIQKKRLMIANVRNYYYIGIKLKLELIT
jgi:phage/plasmid-associated DNA primase